MGALKNIPACDVKKVRSKSDVTQSSEERWKNSALREFDGPLSREERRTCKIPPEIQGASCAPGETTSKTKKDAEQYSRSNVLQRLRWQRQRSWTLFLSFLVWPEKQVTQFQSAHRKNDRSSQTGTTAKRRMPGNLCQDSSTTKTKQLESHWCSCGTFWMKLVLSTNSQPSLGKKNLRRDFLKKGSDTHQRGIVFTCAKSLDYSFRFMWMI